MLINILDKGLFLQLRDCRTLVLQDGRTAAVFQGLAYPLLPTGDAVDISGEAFPRGLGPIPKLATCKDAAFAVIEGEDEAYVLIDGARQVVDRVVKVMSQKAITVLRNGRYFGDAVDGLQPDWFIRIVKPAGHEGNLSLHLKALLDLQDGQPEPAAESAVQLRSRLLIGELVASRSRELQAQREIAGLRHKLANIAIPPEPGGDIASYPADLSYIGVRGDEVVEEEIEETADTAPLSGLSYPLIFSNI